VQFDEKWGFVGKKEKRCRADDPADRRCGDNWDHVAFDPEHKLVVSLVPGKRTRANVRRLVQDFHRRTGGRLVRLMTSDEYKPYREAILQTYGEPYPRQRKGRRGRHPKPGRRVPEGLLYATVHKHRRNGRVVRVSTHLIYGTPQALEEALTASAVSQSLNIAFVERYNATDRHQNARKVRKTYRFSKDWEIHNAATCFTTYSYNFCWPVRTLRVRHLDGSWGPPRTPALAAGLTDHVWTLEEWLTHPVPFRSSA
jgi:IS1 family transposase